MSKINLIVFATHHLSGNIAAQRFKGLLKYLDHNQYQVHVFAVPGPHLKTAELLESVAIHSIPGRCVGSGALLSTNVFCMLSAFLTWVPFRFQDKQRLPDSWLMNALRAADDLCVELMDRGQPCVVLGTYSPIDALIAAACLSKRCSMPCILDFRDGLVYESLGKSGWFSALMRRLVERSIMASADLIITVSMPLVEYFRRKYPGRLIELLPNGYDSEDFNAKPRDLSSKEKEIVARFDHLNGIIIGHFGRVGASDQSATKSLEDIVCILNKIKNEVGQISFVVAGELTEREKYILGNANFNVYDFGKIERSIALELMKRCNVLLLLTGNRVSCATGKIFEYIAVERPVLHITQEPLNEAYRILADIGAGVTATGRASDLQLVRDFLTSDWSESSRQGVLRYSKESQAQQLDLMIRCLCGQVEDQIMNDFPYVD